MAENEELVARWEDKIDANEAKLKEYVEVINLATKNVKNLNEEKAKLKEEHSSIENEMDKQKFAHGKMFMKYAMLLMEFERLYIQKHGDIGVLEMKPPSPTRAKGDAEARR